jgi:transposase
MPPPIARDIKHDIIRLTQENKREQDIADELQISLSTVQRTKAVHKKTGDVEKIPKKSGPKGKITRPMEEVFLSLKHF